jgi:8-oxo-dGTP diphosphatase
MKPVVDVVAGLVIRNGNFLVAQRPPGKHMAGLWEFPGGKVHSGESFPSALKREWLEELGIHIEPLEQVFSTEFELPEKCIQLHFFTCHWVSGELQSLENNPVCWMKPADMQDKEFPPADIDLIHWLRAVDIVGDRIHL